MNISASASLSASPSQKEKSRKMKEETELLVSKSLLHISFLGPINFFICWTLSLLSSSFQSFWDVPLSCVEQDRNDIIQRVTLYGEVNLNLVLLSSAHFFS